MREFVKVSMYIDVDVDETKFTEEFMQEFRESFYDFHTIEDHIEHLATLFARGLCYNGSFIEGYGETKEMGIKFKMIDIDREIE